jgi:tetratricopeptide (TPR) repeat protein
LRATGSKDDVARANYNLGNALLEKNEVDEAIACYQKAIELESDFFDAYNNLGNAFLRKGSPDAAVSSLTKALQLSANLNKDDQARAHFNLANALLVTRHIDEATEHYRSAIELSPAYSEAHNNLATALLQKGLTNEAIQQFKRVVELRSDQGGPSLARAHYNLANALLDYGQIDEAIVHYGKALEIEPGYVDARTNLGNALHQKGTMDRDAIGQYEEALRLDSSSLLAISQLAWVLATSSEKGLRNGARAVEFAERAERLSHGKDPRVLRCLAAAYAENREFSKATEAARRALTLFTAQGDDSSRKILEREIALYEAGSPFQKE